MTCVLWFRRDLRLDDHPALLEAAADAPVVGLFVVDPALFQEDSPRSQRLLASLAALDAQLGGSLVVRAGDPRTVVPAVAAEAGASTVHVTRETTPYGRRRDAAVERALADAGCCSLLATGTPYAVGPGLITTGSGTPYRKFTPYSKSWREHGWPAPARRQRGIRWHRLDAHPNDVDLPAPGGDAGEDAALRRWHEWLDDGGLESYGSERNRPDLDTTSRLSIPLKYGELHPRTLLEDIERQHGGDGADRFVTELAWREFYADVLWHQPDSAWSDLRPELAGMDYDEGPQLDELVDLWRAGMTGFPIVDAGMRQLLSEGWMHNRVRMITASFLVKDLHVRWQVGAKHFLEHLLDGDIASNSHGWQWVAGTGTDAAPYFRIFNPITQGRRFDPTGEYVRRWIPELRHLTDASVHEPWKVLDGLSQGYPEPILDHAEARAESLDRYQRSRAGAT